MTRLKILLPSALLVLFCLGYSAYWLYTAQTLKTRLNDWAAGERAQGREVAWAHLALSGFPFRFELTADDIVYERIGERGRLVWRAPKITAIAQSYALGHIIFIAPGKHDLVFTPRDGTPARHYEISADEARASVVGAGFLRFERLSMEVRGFDGRGLSGSVAGKRLTAATFMFQARVIPSVRKDSGKDSGAELKNDLQIAFSGENIRLFGALAEQVAPLLPPAISHADAQGIFQNRVTKGRLVSLVAWRDWVIKGGKFKFEEANIVAKPLNLRAHGEMGLDRNAELSGKLTLRLGGYNALIDGLVATPPGRPRLGTDHQADAARLCGGRR